MKRAVGDGSLYYGDYGLFSELVTLCGKFGVSSDGLSFKDFASTISSSTMRKMLGFLETAMKVLGTPGEFQVPLRNARESLEDHRLREDLGMER
jgi:hypothetical protein